jgi:predicted DNA-binding transcriptional regulator AlpA
MSHRKMLTPAEVIDEYDIPRSSFYRWLRSGRGPTYIKYSNGTIKIRRSDLEAWIKHLERRSAA